MFRLLLLCFLSAQITFAQNKKIIDHADVHRWQKIEQTRITRDGNYTAWVQTSVTEGNPTLLLWNNTAQSSTRFERSTDPRFTEDGKFLIFRIKPALDTLKAQRRKKVKDDDLPKDSLGILNLATGAVDKVPRLKSITVPEKWSGWIMYQIEPEKPAKGADKGEKKKEGKKPKKEDKDNGYRLIVRDLRNGRQDTIGYVQQYTAAKRKPFVLLSTAGVGDTLTFPLAKGGRAAGVYCFDLERFVLTPLWRGKGKYPQLSIDDFGQQAAFLADLDTTKARIRPWKLLYWKNENLQDSARLLTSFDADFLKEKTPKEAPETARWNLSEHAKPLFSDDGSKLFFGIAAAPVLNDTTLLNEEIVNVEVWNTTDPRMYTQQKNRIEEDKKRSYTMVWHTDKKRFAQLSSPEVPEVRYAETRNPNLALAYTEEPYLQSITWDGAPNKDLYALDLTDGSKKQIVRNLRCNPRISPDARYILWWSAPDTAWYAWNARSGNTMRLTNNRSVKWYDEENDVPDYPSEYGVAAWMEGDEAVLVYDRYDIWRIDPSGEKAPKRLTQGRESATSYRYLKLDPDERFIPYDATALLLHQVNDQTKEEGYVWLNPSNGKISPFEGGNYAYSRQPIKAKGADYLVFTKENFQTFPDLLLRNYSPKNKNNAAAQRISNANPQQSEYRWGSIEMVEWTSLTGEKLRGMLTKPEGFDPKKQYPMIVNFYERSSGELLRHRGPDFHRSQINYTVYASRGYVIFNPDIPYRTGYPGESAYNAIMSGVTHLIAQGFVDPKRVALQGHSWGGYQAAYIVTRTDLFACAEAGAPVANMTSAYGGIRWESGLSRMFQYEHQQSRIGGSLWEYPMRYLENSPLFSMDKVNTPLLILHNDKDGAVPWYQGIEMYSALRRLGKPAWMLNYNDEPHWPVKLQNRIDFQQRMQQFFDHYLMGAAAPRWMKRGVPALEKGILQGLETDER